MAKIRQETKKLRYKWIFWDRKSLIPKKISKKGWVLIQNWGKNDKKQDLGLKSSEKFKKECWAKNKINSQDI